MNAVLDKPARAIVDTRLDIVAQALDQITSLHHDKPKFRAFITAILQQLQPLIDVAETMMLWRSIDYAEGEMLDMIAETVGAPIMETIAVGRSSDEETEMQRIVIRAEILKNHSHGFTPEMSEAMGLLFQTAQAFVWNNKDMSFDVNVGHILTPVEIFLLHDWDILPRPAGVQLRDFVYWDNALPVFGFEHQEGTFGFSVGYFALVMR